jgi:hypothetical protein
MESDGKSFLGKSFGDKIWWFGGECVTLLGFCDARRIGEARVA